LSGSSDAGSPAWGEIILKTAVNAGGFAHFFGRLRLALSAELPFLGLSNYQMLVVCIPLQFCGGHVMGTARESCTNPNRSEVK
jgi:hypothetical protein